MISAIELVQLKAYARQDGLILGAVWIVAFACFIGSMNDAALQIGFMAGILSTPFVVFYMLRHYRDKVLTGTISYKRAFAFIAYTMTYASLLLAAATFAYFYFFDNGTFFGTLMSNIKLPEVQKTFTDAGMNPKDIEEQLVLISESRPIDFAFSILFEGIIIAVIHAALLSLFGKKNIKN